MSIVCVAFSSSIFSSSSVKRTYCPRANSYPLTDLGAVDGPLVFGAEELLLDAAAALFVQHVEADLLR